MSGPKGGAYRVETAEQREARMLRDAKAQYAQAESSWDSIVSRIAAMSAVTGTAPSLQRPAKVLVGADSAAYTAAATALQDAAAAAASVITQAREDAATAAHAAQVARILERLTSEPQPPDEVTRASRWQASRAETAQASPPAETIDWGRVKERIERRLAALADLDHDATHLQGLLADIAAATAQSRIDLLIGEIDHVIAEAREVASRRDAIAATRGELAALNARIGDLTGDKADALRRRISGLIAAEAAELPVELVAAVETALQRADAEADRRHVVAVMHKALEQLGYVAGPEFSTDLSGAKGAAFARSESSHYGVKLRLEPGSARFSAQAVKSDAALTTIAEDVAAEHAFCEALDKMVELAKRDGVELDVDIRTKPGASQVQKVADAALGKATGAVGRRGAHAQKQQSR